MMWQKQSRWYLQVLGDLGLGSLAGLDGVKKSTRFAQLWTKKIFFRLSGSEVQTPCRRARWMVTY